MSKAKELATKILDVGTDPDWEDIHTLRKIAEDVLSEPEPDLKGWIEVTFLQKEDLENVSGKGFIDVKTIQMCSFDPINQKSGITFHHAPDTCFHVQESYDSIKQKIKEAL